MENIQYGGLLYRVGEQDFILGSTSETISILLKKRGNPDAVRYEYDQLAFANGGNSCTVHGMAGALGDLMNYKFSTDELQELWNLAIEQGADPKYGWYFNSACDLVRKWWNAKFPENQTATFRVSSSISAFKDALAKGYDLAGGYMGNSEYNTDSSDGILAGTEFKPSTYGHCIRIFMDGDKITVIDNYFGRKTNRYTVDNLSELVKNGVFFDGFYLFIKKNDMTTSELKRLEAQKLGLWNGKDENAPITRGECVEIAMNLKNLMDELAK